MAYQPQQQGGIGDIIQMMIANGQQNQPQNVATQALAQRFQPTMGDVGTASMNTARSFLSPNFKPQSADMAAQQRVTNELTPYTAALGLQKASREVNAPYSDYGKINDDLRRGLISPEMAQQALSKNDLDTQLKQAQIAALNAKASRLSTTNGWSTGNPALDKSMATQDAKNLDSYTDMANSARTLADKAELFKTYRGQVNAGGPIGGLLPNISNAAQNADALSTDMATALTSLQKGSQSDKELSLSLRSVPGLRMGQGAVDESVKKYKAAAAILSTRQSFMDQYAQSHGTLRGSEQLWNQFRQQNPMLINGQIREDLENIYNPVQDFSHVIGGNPMQPASLDDGLDEDSIVQELQRRGVQ